MGRTWGTRTLAGALLVTLMTLTAACGDDDDGDSGDQARGEAAGDDESTTSDPTTSDPTTTEQPTLTTVAGEGPAEWLEVVNDTQIRIAELGLNPDPERVRDVVAEECGCYQRYYETIAAMADEGQTIVGESTHVLFVKVEEEFEDGGVRLTSKGQSGAGQFLDANGEVLDEFDVGEPGCTSLLVKPDGPDGAYRIHDEVNLEGCPPEAG